MAAKISVIMPVYNTEAYIWEAIESILQQSFIDFEYIIIDDGSTDKSYDICLGYAKKDSRIRLYKNSENKWISYTRNKLIEYADTWYIAPQDSDDISESDRLEREFNFLEDNIDYGVVSGNNSIINEKWNCIWLRKYSDDIKNTVLKKSPISQWSSMFRKHIFTLLGWYDSTLSVAEDYDLWLRMYSYGYGIKNLDFIMYRVRIRQGQTKSKQLKQTLKNTLLIQERAMKQHGLKWNYSDKIYHFFEKLLLFLPSSWILFLFTKFEYERKTS